MQPMTRAKVMNVPLKDFGELQTRYQSLGLAKRASAVLTDAAAALQVAEAALAAMAASPHTKKAFAQLRQNAMLAGRLRASEAKNLMLDGSDDYIEVTRRKLAAWKHNLERLSQGEGIIARDDGRESLDPHAPLALALAGSASISNYLLIAQLALGELTKLDEKHAPDYTSRVVEIRRCATVLSDCEHASGLQALAH